MPLDPVRLRLLAIADPTVLPWSDLVEAGAAALSANLPALMIRDKQTPNTDLEPFAARLRECAARHGALLVVNRRIDLAGAVNADGLHTGADGPCPTEIRRRLGPDVLVGYSAHGVSEALEAFAVGADYVFLSPVFETPGKRGVFQPLGMAPLRELTRRAPGPVLALGGVDSSRVGTVLEAGASGVAAIRAVFASGDPAAATRRLLGAFPSMSR